MESLTFNGNPDILPIDYSRAEEASLSSIYSEFVVACTSLAADGNHSAVWQLEPTVKPPPPTILDDADHLTANEASNYWIQ
jgi:hypothetical protein